MLKFNTLAPLLLIFFDGVKIGIQFFFHEIITGSDSGGAIDLRAKLSRVNKRAEERAKRFGNIDESGTPKRMDQGRGKQGNFNKGFNKVRLKCRC